MPFVQIVREKYEQQQKVKAGDFEVLETAEFDQLEVLESLSNYLHSTLQLNKISFEKISEKTDNVALETLKSCSPGAPIIVYSILEK